jgi:adenylate kinase
VRLLLVAYPGAGKGTQAAKLSAHYGIEHLSSGALLRDEVTRRTKIGQIAAAYLERGDLVPDELVFEMLAAPVLEATHNGGYVLDGYPRTLRQAEEAYALARRLEGIELQAVVYLRVSNDELNRRLVSRSHREGRSDDTEIGIAHRFEVFDAQTKPLLGFYARRGILLEVNGEQPVQDVFAEITNAIDSLHIPRLQRPQPPASG